MPLHARGERQITRGCQEGRHGHQLIEKGAVALSNFTTIPREEHLSSILDIVAKCLRATAPLRILFSVSV